MRAAMEMENGKRGERESEQSRSRSTWWLVVGAYDYDLLLL